MNIAQWTALMRPPVHSMTDDEIVECLTELRQRVELLDAERFRRVISMDGDIGRREEKRRPGLPGLTELERRIRDNPNKQDFTLNTGRNKYGR